MVGVGRVNTVTTSARPFRQSHATKWVGAKWILPPMAPAMVPLAVLVLVLRLALTMRMMVTMMVLVRVDGAPARSHCRALPDAR